MNVFSAVEKRGHEQVVYFHYPHAGLKAIVAIHNTVLGPALGGCRVRMYADEVQALDDVLRLSEGMTYKSSLAGLDLGGGKSCIIADPAMKEGRPELFRQFGRCLNALMGRYITAEDMGTSVQDIMWMREESKYAAGFSIEQGGGGDPSPWTARGVFGGIKSACQKVFGSSDLSKRSVAVQGVGHVGMYLVEHLRAAGAKVIVCDTNSESLRHAKEKFGVEVVDVEKIYDADCEIFAPCAIGQTVNPQTLKRLKCRIIGGAANNQLTDSSVYSTILEKKITYCPDFAINSGGVISVGGEYIPGGWNRQWVEKKVDAIAGTVARVLDEADKRNKFPEVVALELAKERIKETMEKKAA